MRGDVVAVIAVFDERRASALVLRIRETRNEHATWQRIDAVRSDRAARGLFEVSNRLHEARLRRIGVNIEDEDFAVLQAAQPKLATVVSESAVVCLVSSAYRLAVDDFAIGGRAGLYVHDDEFVRAVAEPLDSERPDINEFLLPFDAGQVGRGAGFIGAGGDNGGSPTAERRDDAGEPGVSFAPASNGEEVLFHAVR